MVLIHVELVLSLINSELRGTPELDRIILTAPCQTTVHVKALSMQTSTHSVKFHIFSWLYSLIQNLVPLDWVGKSGEGT